MPNILIQPTKNIVKANPKPVVSMVTSSSQRIVINAATPKNITPKNTAATIAQAVKPTVQVVSQKTVMQVQQSSPTISIGRASGLVKSVRFDRVGVYDYIGAALSPNAIDSSPVWRIRRVRNDMGAAAIVESAGGSNAYISVWNDRLSLVYV